MDDASATWGARLKGWGLIAWTWIKWAWERLRASLAAFVRSPGMWAAGAALAVGGFLAGEAVGSRDVPGLRAENARLAASLSSTTRAAQTASSEVLRLRNELKGAEARLAALPPPAVVPPAAISKPAAKKPPGKALGK